MTFDEYNLRGVATAIVALNTHNTRTVDELIDYMKAFAYREMHDATFAGTGGFMLTAFYPTWASGRMVRASISDCLVPAIVALHADLVGFASA